MLKGILVAFFCFILFFILHIVIFHNVKVKRRFRTILTVWLGLFPVYIILFVLLPEEIFSPCINFRVIGFIYGIAIYLIFLPNYLNLIIFADRSVSTRIMVDIESSPDERLSLEKIKKIYDLNEKIYYELEDMKYVGYISEESGYFRNTPKGSRHARVMKFLKDYLHLGLR